MSRKNQAPEKKHASIPDIYRKLTSFTNDFERDFELEIMKSERLRSLFLAYVFSGLTLLSVILGIFANGMNHDVFHDRLNYYYVFALFSIIALYEFFFATLLARFVGKKLMFPVFPRYINALVEASVPTLMIYYLIGIFGPEEAMALPAAFAYFLFISLSCLRVDSRLSLFTGAVAAIGYFALALAFFQPSAQVATDSALSNLPINAARAFLVFIAGVVAAFVSHEIRSRLTRLVRTIDERNRVASLFGQHVSPAIMEKLMERGDNEMTSEHREVCVLFLDIRDFTAFSQNRDPEEVVEYLNSLFGFMIEIVNERGGFINKFLGDGFMAVFGAPVKDDHTAAQAIRAAIAIVDKLEALVASGELLPTRIGIGMHLGIALTGNVGSALRKEYTVIGDAVNVAARIEPLNKEYGSTLLVSGETWEAAKAELASTLSGEPIAIGKVRVKGRDDPIEIIRLK